MPDRSKATYDVIVVGSGASGGWACKRLCEAGVKVALGTDAPAIFHGRNAEELEVLVRRGMTPIQAIRSATTVAADLIDHPELGRPGEDPPPIRTR